jgi:tRNA threonylcarbamoyladenosine biosynthesis protein TsaE
MAILDERTLEFISSSVEQTVRLGVRLGELLQAGDVLCLAGELGAGKTVLARGVGRGWGTAVRVTSPTFTLINEYPRAHDGAVLYHVDGYRLSGPADIATTGLEDLFSAENVIVIEWPERLAMLLPEDRLDIALAYVNETKRSLRFNAAGARSEDLLKEFRRRAFGV